MKYDPELKLVKVNKFFGRARSSVILISDLFVPTNM